MGNKISKKRKTPTSKQIDENKFQEIVTEKFLAEISKKIGSEWILVCVTLGVPSYVIDQIKIDGTSDVPTKIFEGLRRWRELRRERSDDELIVELKEALGDHGRQDLVEVVENHIKKCMLEKEKNINTALHSMETEDTEVKDFREKLHTLNYLETQKVPVSPLQRTSKMPLENIFAPISIREDLEYQGKGRNIGMKNKRTKPVNSPDDMFYIDGDVARNVFMLGDAGIGKSVFCLRLVENWCKAQKICVSDRGESNVSWVKALKIFDFLFFVQLRHVNKSRSSVIDMIVNDVFHSHPGNHDVIRRVLYSQRFRCLIVVDGVDEWKVTYKVKSELNVKGLPDTENMVNCTFVWSMRPWMIDKFSEMIRGNDRVVEIQGLDTDSIDVVIEKMLVNFYELDKESSLYKEKEKYITEKSNDQTLESIMQIPLMAVACIQTWFEEKEVGNSMTSLYVAILDFLIKRSNKKAPLTADIKEKLANQSVTERKIPPILNQNKNIKQVMTMIMKLGRIAHDDLISNETHLVFRVEDIEKYLEEYELDLALRIGILSKCEAPGSFNEENVSVNFFHKSVEEFLAATYIENQGHVHTFFGHLSSFEVIMELGNVLIFLSGLNPMLGSRISKEIVDVANVDTDICKLRTFSDAVIYRNNKVELLYRLQVKCYREIDNAQSSKNTTQELPCHVLDVFVGVDSGLEIIKATADILTHHHADIRFLYLDEVSTDTENGIPDSLLTQYLDQTVSLQSMYIDGYNTNRTLHHNSDIFSSLSALILYNIILTPDTLSKLNTTLQSNTVIQTLGLMGIKCQFNEDQDPELPSLTDIIQTLPDLSSLSALRFQVINVDDKDVFRDVLSHLSHLHGIHYYGTSTYPDDDKYDRDIVQTLSTSSGLRWLYLGFVDLGDSGLQLSHDMLNIEQITLYKVNMSSSGWRYFIDSILNIKHKVDVNLDDVDIDEEVKTMIRSTPELEVSHDKSNDDGSHYIYFTRV